MVMRSPAEKFCVAMACCLFGILEELNQAVGKSLRVPGRIKFDGELFASRHLPEVGQISADDGHAISACQVRDAAASRGGRVRHDCDVEL